MDYYYIQCITGILSGDSTSILIMVILSVMCVCLFDIINSLLYVKGVKYMTKLCTLCKMYLSYFIVCMESCLRKRQHSQI